MTATRDVSPASVVWGETAIDEAARFLRDDVQGLRQLMYATDLLAERPRPVGTVAYGSRDVRRMHVGRYRVLYRIAEATRTVVVLHVGRLG